MDARTPAAKAEVQAHGPLTPGRTRSTTAAASAKAEAKFIPAFACFQHNQPQRRTTMGSYLFIVNNTEDHWTCKIGPDEAALKIAGIIISIIGSAATVIGTLGAAAPVATALAADGVISVFGVSTSALATAAAAAGTVSTAVSVTGAVSGFSIAVANGVNDNLIKEGYQNIAPGEKQSRLTRCTCVLSSAVPPTTPTTTTRSSSGSSSFVWRRRRVTGSEEQQQSARALEAEDGAQIIYFYANGTNTYHEDN
ncbi:unnamed protein product [Phytophthora lilii]|uniref:Unnamed protein product n=1 Tax=Phytophthora lilii TaxID=2077276 RepID=A0A9W6UBG0_9STRA|nr:unnamed protein product [Phytophthora lilii]